MTFHNHYRAQCRRSLTLGHDVIAVQSFMMTSGTALANAALLLGGPAASSSVFILIESLNGAVRISRTQRKQLITLHQLLTLQNVSDPDSIEAERFAEIDPASPNVEEICLLAEALERVLQKIADPFEAAFSSPITPSKVRKQQRRTASRSSSAERRRPKRMAKVVGGAV